MDLQTNKTNLNQLVNLNGWSISWIGWWWRYMKQNGWWCTAPNDIFPFCVFNIHSSPHLLLTSLIHHNLTTLSLEEKLAVTLSPTHYHRNKVVQFFLFVELQNTWWQTKTPSSIFSPAVIWGDTSVSHF